MSPSHFCQHFLPLCEYNDIVSQFGVSFIVSKREELRTEDVSRVSFQLLSAIDHCAKHGIIHRDLKVRPRLRDLSAAIIIESHH